MDVEGSASDGSRQVGVRFVTKLRAPSLRVPRPPSPSLPTSPAWASPRSSTSSSKTPIPNTRTNLSTFLWMESLFACRSISSCWPREKVLEIEYVKAIVPKKQEDPCIHDDWVSAVDSSNGSFILTGSYDGFARVWTGGAVCTHILAGHNDAVTSARVINRKGHEGENNFYLATGSKDRSLRLWKFDAAEHVDHPLRIGAYKILPGHTSSVQSIASDPSSEMICSGSWDCSIKLWEVNGSEAAGDTVSIKKRKLNSTSSESEESQLEGAATSTLLGHTQCVSSVAWPHPQIIFSASWDHSIRQWDVQTGKEIRNMVCGKALNCLDIGGESSALIAAGGSDPILRIWDPRQPGTLAPVFQFSSHSSWISACKWHPRSWFHLLSTSFDGKVMLWDLRTAWPLVKIDSHNDKVLCADWWKDDSVASGGADSKLYITSGIEIH
uniref:Ribosome biogenesis protein WDR12 homolog n=1 Tax=Ananas comosus var. bracteatus TaxID=296719 RepID=A0A6V7PNX8_ANACO|nr:unnamed protein product [Ananas comosus var. bracteatus]